MPQTAYTFEVSLIPDVGGPPQESFLRKNLIVSRTIRLGGTYTLHDLHRLIFEAFDRFDPHLYEFQIGGTHPMHRVARCFQPRIPGEEDSWLVDDPPPGDAAAVRIESLGLKVRNRFFYWFDFGDDWWHKVKVVHIGPVLAGDARPTILGRVGPSPAQYPDFGD